ncbi:MAG TPA: gliding motility protein GldN [Ferruginibacter sp.]|nr:gliding motility protein GldN [Ferruginibacter sp.]
MKKHLIKVFCFAVVLSLTTTVVSAQKKKAAPRAATKRPSTAQTKKTKAKTKATNTAAEIETVQTAVVQAPPPPPPPDSLPLTKVKKSLRPDEAVDTRDIRDRNPLAYEHLRVDDAVYRHKVWREIDAREKMNLPFRYSADENNGNQRFISILLQAVQDGDVTVFDPIDDRFTTPLTIGEVSTKIGGGVDSVPHYNDVGEIDRYDRKVREINFDSFYKFKIKEEVIFDKEASRLFWRILGIAPVRNVYSSAGDFIGTQDVFWVYYPDMRPVFAKYEVYNGKNFGARSTWEELFENRMFSGRIIKSTIDNPFNLPLEAMPGIKDNKLFQLLEGERIKEKIFNYELDLWSY